MRRKKSRGKWEGWKKKEEKKERSRWLLQQEQEWSQTVKQKDSFIKEKKVKEDGAGKEKAALAITSVCGSCRGSQRIGYFPRQHPSSISSSNSFIPSLHFLLSHLLLLLHLPPYHTRTTAVISKREWSLPAVSAFRLTGCESMWSRGQFFSAQVGRKWKSVWTVGRSVDQSDRQCGQSGSIGLQGIFSICSHQMGDQYQLLPVWLDLRQD